MNPMLTATAFLDLCHRQGVRFITGTPCSYLKPLINGVQIATVVGPPGEEIYTDENSRVRLMFRWDRDAKGDDTSSCWIRVAQNWGGGQWGHIAIPRIGQSVLVAFTEGDPDQPLIIGRTYNADHVTPYQLPHHKTKMAIRSQTHKGAGFNEMSMEDEKGQENFFLHAQKDMTSKVLNNQVHAVDASGFHSYGQQHQPKLVATHQGAQRFRCIDRELAQVARAAHVVKRRLRWSRSGGQPIETVGAIASFDDGAGKFTIHANTSMYSYIGFTIATALNGSTSSRYGISTKPKSSP